jgi:hypothetical protein
VHLLSNSIPIRICGNRHHIPVDQTWPPVLGVIILLCTGNLTIPLLWNSGVIGDESVQPYSIILLFLALAYVCVSIDLTGALVSCYIHRLRAQLLICDL